MLALHERREGGVRGSVNSLSNNICKVGLGILVHIHSRDNCRCVFVLQLSVRKNNSLIGYYYYHYLESPVYKDRHCVSLHNHNIISQLFPVCTPHTLHSQQIIQTRQMSARSSSVSKLSMVLNFRMQEHSILFVAVSSFRTIKTLTLH